METDVEKATCNIVRHFSQHIFLSKRHRISVFYQIFRQKSHVYFPKNREPPADKQ